MGRKAECDRTPVLGMPSAATSGGKAAMIFPDHRTAGPAVGARDRRGATRNRSSVATVRHLRRYLDILPGAGQIADNPDLTALSEGR
jgi:hypothetical protein